MDITQRLFGRNTIQDWLDLRSKIISSPNDKFNWQKAIGLFDTRLETRYFNPIEKILRMRVTTGEGFAVMTLVCSLIEFLQSCYEGKTYQYKAAESDFVYGDSGKKFKSFLLLHEPFKSIFTKPVSLPDKKIKNFADDFYLNVRCGLLHEAATRNNWIIKTQKSSITRPLVDISDENCKIIFRESFVLAINVFIDNYKNALLNDIKDNGKSLRENFCRKVDALCNIKDKSSWWI